MDLTAFAKQLEHQEKAPVDQWNPPYCGDINLVIRASGQWDYENSPIGRQALVKLFARVLKREGDRYFLVTPVEKIGIQVEDLPFVVVSWEQQHHQGEPIIQVTTNVGERYILSEEHPLVVDANLPAVQVRDGMRARVHRNVYYQWADIATPAEGNEDAGYYVRSAGMRFLLLADQ
ncbi:DUF1285 domain-containing protein [Aliidiomarina sanyensis]|uniref:DUF1285 domain-containing protein n=1 Tax=Aliidiomarina sanyensis TaxID=1249555 RepID=A0A432WBE8_9GAMM|nr:DUF1285 domain-containing protein [Aliidiomarina sanyensis]RUO29083.1 DUF1285 domain-containing protein [Aliidiomarina sanyensis]